MKKTLFTALALVMLVGAAIVLPLSSAHADRDVRGGDGDEDL